MYICIILFKVVTMGHDDVCANFECVLLSFCTVHAVNLVEALCIISPFSCNTTTTNDVVDDDV